MLGDEARIVDAFCVWLVETGWTVEREVAFCDVRAARAGRVMYAEAKGRTSSPGLDIDTMYGQLLRRMPAELVGEVEFAVVVPSAAVAKAERVSARVRDLLGIEVYSVDELGTVAHHPAADQGEPPIR